jgi:hypothetical protein
MQGTRIALFDNWWPIHVGPETGDVRRDDGLAQKTQCALSL